MKRTSIFTDDEKHYTNLGLVDSVAAQMSSRIPLVTEQKSSEAVHVIDDDNPSRKKYRKSEEAKNALKSENDPSFELAEIEKNRNMLLAKLRAGSDYLQNKRRF